VIASNWHNRRRRALLLQLLLLALLAGALALMAIVTAENLRRRGIVGGFAFLTRTADFGLGETPPLPTLRTIGLWGATAAAVAALIAVLRRRQPSLAMLLLALLVAPLLLTAAGFNLSAASFDPQHSLLFALLTGFANTLKVAATAIVLASVIGLLVGLMRLSPNLLLRGWAIAYVETFRNIPLLIQVFFWYFGVLRALPNIRQSLAVPGGIFLNNRGLFLPEPMATSGTAPVSLALIAAVLLLWYSRKRPLWIAVAAALPLIAGLLFGAPLAWSFPALRGFNFAGGMVLTPEFFALVLALSIYSGAFTAEIVRSGVAAISAGQRDAARALGLKPSQAMRLVVLPQALRVMRPPLISQFAAQVKDSSLGVAIAYPELISVSNTVINQTGQVIEMLFVLVVVYMTLNLAMAAAIGRRDLMPI
jgi:general L-amino acid transport system permease protein